MKLFYCFPSKFFINDGHRFIFQERNDRPPERPDNNTGGNRGNPEQRPPPGQETRKASEDMERMGLSFLAGDLGIRTSGIDDMDVLRQEVEREIQAGGEVIRLVKREFDGPLVLPTDYGNIRLTDLQAKEGGHREAIAVYYGMPEDSRWSAILQNLQNRSQRTARRGR